MKLITPEFEALFKKYPLRSQAQSDDPIIVAKLFNPCGSATWYLAEYDPQIKQAFGYVQGLVPGEWNDEWGYISLEELEEIRIPITIHMGNIIFEKPNAITIERDLYFDPQPFSQCVPGRKKGEQ